MLQGERSWARGIQYRLSKAQLPRVLATALLRRSKRGTGQLLRKLLSQSYPGGAMK